MSVAKQSRYSVPVYSSRKQLAGWSPFKSSGGRPPDPPAIGAAPLGGPNPRFPSVGPAKMTPPAGGYQSIISTKPAFDQGQINQMSRAQMPPQSYGTGSGDRSRSAFARALTDSTNSELRDAATQYNQQQLQQAQKSRAEDILQQRQNAADVYRMNVSNAVSGKDIATGYDTGAKDLMQAYYTEKWNQEAERTAIALRFVGSLI